MIALMLVLIGVAARLLPHPYNFTPVTAVALFSGVVLSPALALTVPLIVMIASDLLIGPHSLFWLTWGCFFAVTLIGLRVKNSASFRGIFWATIGGSVLFFVLTNLGVFLSGDMYSKNFSGLAECYVMAIPFFRNSIIGDLLYSALFFSVFILAKSLSKISTRSAKV